MPSWVEKHGMPDWSRKLRTGCGLALLAGFVYIIMPNFPRTSEKQRQSFGASNLKQISFGILSYAQDNDDKFPPTEQWMETIKTYRPQRPEGDAVYYCPSVPKKSDTYSYAYNSNVSEKASSQVVDPWAKMLVYDSTTLTSNASDPGTSLPPKGRHAKGNNIAFVDGHVKRFLARSYNGKTVARISGVTP